jgi:pyrroline-5-carboxylate reductase
MGSAILSGILDASKAISSPFSRILACTKTQSSAEKLDTRFRDHGSPLTVGFFAGENTAAAEEADVIILGCKPYLVDAVLAEEGLADALAGKLVISIIAGKTIDVLSEGISQNQTEYKNFPSEKAVIVRAIPNVAASVRESMTVIELPTPSPSNDQKDLIIWIFSQIGQTSFLSSDLFDCGTMLMASIATVSVAVDGILDGCVAEGIKRADASEMTAQCLLGLARLLREGHHPAVLRESISSPRGCTIQGLLAVERGGVRSAFAESVIAGTRHLKRLQGRE